MTGLEALETLEDAVLGALTRKRDWMKQKREIYRKLPPDDPTRDGYLYEYRESFYEVQTLKLVLVWINDMLENEFEEDKS